MNERRSTYTAQGSLSKEYLQLLHIAKGSAGEIRSLLRLAQEIGYLDQAAHAELRDTALELSRYLSNQIKRDRRTSPHPFVGETSRPRLWDLAGLDGG